MSETIGALVSSTSTLLRKIGELPLTWSTDTVAGALVSDCAGSYGMNCLLITTERNSGWGWMTSSMRETSGNEWPTNHSSLTGVIAAVTCFRWVYNKSRPVYTNFSADIEDINNDNFDCVTFTANGWQVAESFCENIGLPFVCKAPGIYWYCVRPHSHQ